MKKEAILTCVSLLVQDEVVPVSGHFASVVGKILHKILVFGATETDKSMRKMILELFEPKFDYYLAQQTNINLLLFFLNDVDNEVLFFLFTSSFSSHQLE